MNTFPTRSAAGIFGLVDLYIVMSRGRLIGTPLSVVLHMRWDL